MGADDSKKRNADAVTLLNYGFSKCRKYEESTVEETPSVPVKGGTEKQVKTAQEKPFTYIDTNGGDLSSVTRKTVIEEWLKAPVKQGMKAGEAIYYLGDEEIGRVDIITVDSIKKATYKSTFEDALSKFFM